MMISALHTFVMPTQQVSADEVPASVAVRLQEFRIVGHTGDNINITGYSNNDPINVWFTQEQTNERWRFDTEDGINYKLVNMTTKKLLSPHNWTLSGDSVLFDDANKEEQLWQFIVTDPLNEEGYVHYKIVNKTDPTKVLTLDADARRVQIENFEGLESQKWTLINVGTPAFPGAEGGGMYTTGGRGGDVYEVTTLADSGPGSLREGVSRSDTTIVFRVGGTIHLESPLKITGSNITIAGQTAPGEGITVSDYATSFQADNIIVRYMRFRLGDRYPSEDDAFGGRYHKNIIIDHSSFSWSVDEVLSMYANENTTLQWSIVSESMLMTTHQKGRHGYAGIWGGNNTSFHHNIIAHNVSRNPRFAGSPNFPIDMYNNVVYNWGFFSTYGGEEGRYNLRNNYYKAGANTYENARNQVFLGVSENTRIFIDGNYMHGYPEVTLDNWKGVGDVANSDSILTEPVTMPQLATVEPAEEAYESVLEGAGAILPRRDAVDARIVQDVINGTGRHINSQSEVGGYLEFDQIISTLVDDDHDGMPNDWEAANGLNPNDPTDRNNYDESGYTYLEVYLNSIVGNGSLNPTVSVVAPMDNTIVAEGSDVQINAEADDVDGIVDKVQFYMNDVLLGEDTSAPYSFTWENVNDGTYFITARAIDDTGASTQSSNVAVHVNKQGDILPWQSTDIGSVAIAGHTQLGVSSSDVTVKSAGDIGYGAEDRFHYAYQTLTGNGEIIARIERVTATDDGAEAGLMIRESLTPSSKFAALLISYEKHGQKAIAFKRTETNSSASRIVPDDFIKTPYWVKLVRLDNQITSLISADGTDWKVMDTVTIPMAETVYFGLAVDASKAEDYVDKYNSSDFTHAQVRALDANYPSAPEGLTATAGDKTLTLSWNEVSVADSYRLYRSEIPGGPYTLIASDIDTTSYIDRNLFAGMTYYYYVTANNDTGSSFSSSVISAVPDGELETIYFINEDFESTMNETVPPGFTFTPDPAGQDHKVVVTDIPASTVGNPSDKALVLYDNGVGSTEFFRKFVPQKGIFTLEADITSTGWPGTSTVLNIQDESGSRTALSFQLRKPTAPIAESDYTLVYKRSGADYKVMDPPANNQWYNLKISFNVPEQTANIYIDDVLVDENAPLESDFSTTGIGRINAKTPGTGKGIIYYDNIKVYVEPVQSPKGLTAQQGDGMVQLDWTASHGASSYSIKRSTINGGPYESIADGITELTYTDRALQNGTTYYYVVTAVGALGESKYSNQAAATPQGGTESVYLLNEDFENTALDTTPAGFTFTPNPADLDHKVVVTGTPAASVGNPSERVLILYDNGVGSTEFFRGFEAQQGTFVVEADITAQGWPGTSTVLSLQNESGSKTALSLQLRKPTAPIAENNYTLVYKRNGADYKLMDPPLDNQWYNLKLVVNVASQSADIYIDNELVEKNAPLESDFSELGIGRITAKTPGTGKGTIYYDNLKVYIEEVDSPKGLSATPGNGMVKLEWNTANGASYYTIKRSTNADGPYMMIADEIPDTTYIDQNVTNGTTYYYVITATGTLGESGASNEVAVVPSEHAVKPAAPDHITAAARNAQVELSWDAVEHALSYKVKRSLSMEGPFAVIASNVDGTVYRDGGLDNDTTYYYIVIATGIGGESEDSESVVGTPIAALATPILNVLPLNNAVLLQWDNVEGAQYYSVKRASSPYGPYTMIEPSVVGTEYEDSGLTNGKPYYYKIAAANSSVQSLDSAVVSVKPSDNDETLPAPERVAAIPDDKSITLLWDAVPNADTYSVKRSESPSGPFIVIAGEITEAEFIDSDLTNGVTYYYNVTASNDAGEGNASATIQEVPAAVLTVATDGSAQYMKIQDAIHAVPNNSSSPTIIKIKDGTYREKLDLPSSKINVRMIGESRDGTILVYGDSASTPDENGNNLGTSNSYSFRVQASNFTAENLTIQNDAGISAGQAVALYANADRLILRNVSLKGHQDTLYANNGRHYYVDSYIEGTVDFIFGGATAVFENSVIHSVGGGYVTAASTAPAKPGYVFINSHLTSEPGVTNVALGRPWRADAHVIYIKSYMGEHISPLGWNNWGNVNNEKTARYGEYASYGPGASAKSRLSWSKQLTAEEASAYMPELLLAGNDGWNPTAIVPLADGNRDLSNLTLNGKTIIEFDPTRKHYDIELEQDSELPLVSASLVSASSEVVVEQADSLPGTAFVHVTAQDGSTRIYTISFEEKGLEPSPSPTVEPSPSPTVEPSPSPTSGPSPTVDPSPTPTSEPSPSPTVDPSPTPTVDPSPSPTVEPSPTPTSEPSPTPSPTPSATPSATPSPSPTVVPSPTPTSEPSPTPSPTPKPTSKPTSKPVPVYTPEPTAEPTSTPVPTQSVPTLNVSEEGDTVTDIEQYMEAASAIYNVTFKQHNSDGTISLLDYVEGMLLTVPLDSSYDPELLALYYYDNDRQDWVYVGGRVNTTIGSISTNITRPGQYAVMVYQPKFNDVTPDHWAEHAISVLSAHHIVKGVDEEQFAPDQWTTRAEFAALLVRSLGLSESNTDTALPFTDVSQQDWFADELSIAYGLGLINGVTQDSFKPHQAISREEMAVLLQRACAYSNSSTTMNNSSQWKLSDLEELSSWAEPSVLAMLDLGIMTGHSDGKFKPKDAATRAETAQVLYRMFYLLK